MMWNFTTYNSIRVTILEEFDKDTLQHVPIMGNSYAIQRKINKYQH